MKHTSGLRPIIDGLSLSLQVDPNLEAGLTKRLLALQKDLFVRPQGYRLTKSTLRQRTFYGHAASIVLDKPEEGWSLGTKPAKPAALIQLSPVVGNAGYGRLEFNPNRLGQGGTVRLFHAISDVLGPAASCLSHATVTGIDVAVDLPGVTVDRFHWERGTNVKRMNIAGGGRLETIYVGKTRGENLCVYDRSNKVPGTAPTTRVERRLKPGIRFGQLTELPNAFAGVLAYDLSQAGVKIPSAWRELFRITAAAVGIKGAVLALPEGSRQHAIDAVNACRLETWDPADIWSRWSAALSTTFGSACLPEWSLFPALPSAPDSPTSEKAA